MTWTILSSPPLSASEQMALDENNLEKFYPSGKEVDNDTYFLRIFEWKNKAITLGRFEKEERTLDLAYVRTNGIEMARRPTGGRAVFHRCNEGEITFSIICPRKSPFYNDSIPDVFRWVSELVRHSLPLPVQNALAREKTESCLPAAKKSETGACFDTLCRYELSLSDSKILGSAQKRTESGILIQSTLLLERDEEFSRVFLSRPAYVGGVVSLFPETKRGEIVASLLQNASGRLSYAEPYRGLRG